MDFGQFAGKNDGPVTHFFSKQFQRPPNPVRSLEENGGPADLSESVEPLISIFRPNGRKPMEREFISDGASNRQGRYYSGRPWNGLHPDPRRNHLPDQTTTGIGNRRRA